MSLKLTPNPNLRKKLKLRYFNTNETHKLQIKETKQRLSLEFEKRQTKHHIYDVQLLEIVLAQE